MCSIKGLGEFSRLFSDYISITNLNLIVHQHTDMTCYADIEIMSICHSGTALYSIIKFFHNTGLKNRCNGRPIILYF